MEDVDFCPSCNGMNEAGGDSGCTCDDKFEHECDVADDRHGFEREEW